MKSSLHSTLRSVNLLYSLPLLYTLSGSLEGLDEYSPVPTPRTNSEKSSSSSSVIVPGSTLRSPRAGESKGQSNLEVKVNAGEDFVLILMIFVSILLTLFCISSIVTAVAHTMQLALPCFTSATLFDRSP